MNVSPPPGYYPDPAAPGYLMYWDGSAWVPASRQAARPGAAESGAVAEPSKQGEAAGESGGIRDRAAATPLTPAMPGLAPTPPPPTSSAGLASPSPTVPAPAPAASAGSPSVRANAVPPQPGERDPTPSSETVPAVAPWESPPPSLWDLEPNDWAAVPDLAPAGGRLAARLVDLIIVFVLSAVPSLPVLLAIMSRITDQIRAAQAGTATTRVYLLNSQTIGLWSLYVVITLAVAGGYEVVQLTRWGQTVGKRLVNVRVTEREGVHNPSPGQAIRRWLSSCLLLVVPIAAVLDVLWSLWDQPYRQCLHDKVAGTIVVREPV